MELPDALIWLVVFFGLIFLFIVFFFAFKMIGNSIQTDMAGQATGSAVGLTLQNYMKTEIVIDGKAMSVAEAVVEAENDKTIQEGLETYTTKFFDDQLSDSWQIRFYYPNEEIDYGHNFDGQVVVGAIKRLAFFGDIQATAINLATAGSNNRIEGYLPSKNHELIKYELDYWVIIWFV